MLFAKVTNHIITDNVTQVDYDSAKFKRCVQKYVLILNV